MDASSRRARSTAWGPAGVAVAALLAFGCEQGEVGGSAVSGERGALTVDHVVATGQVCAPTGKHGKHQAIQCATCHQCAGTVSFDAAVAGPGATFDATTKNCSSIACHGVAAGTFTYSTWDYGLDQLVNVSVPYGGSAGTGQPNWYAASTGGGCDACHGYPPKYNGVAYWWHSGQHGTTISNGNTCQLCHPDATGAYVYAPYTSSTGGLITSCAPGTYCAAPGTITVPSRHGNGVVDVTPGWNSRCSGCH